MTPPRFLSLSQVDLNGFSTPDSADRTIYLALIAVAERSLDKPGLAALFRSLAHPRPSSP